MRLDAFERIPLTFGPSPVHRLERLTAHLGGAELWAKRDDVNSGLAFGGNKTRKLEYLVADALAKGCDTLVSIGGVQSNHTRQVAAAAARVRAEVRARAGALGRLARRRLRPRRQHPAQPPDGRRRAARPGGVRDRLQGELGAGDRRRRGGRRHAVRDPGGRVGPRARRARLRALGAGGGRAGGGARRVLRHRDRVLGHRLDAGRDGRGLRGPGARAAGDRDRRLGEARGDARRRCRGSRATRRR